MQLEKSRRNIIKKTSLIGGANIITIILGMFRVKVIAILVGPVGVGVLSIFQNLIDLIKSITNLGINYSGVKEVASNSNDDINLFRSILILKRWSLTLGFVGMLLTVIFSVNLSKYSFGSRQYSNEIVVLSVTILFSSISGVQLAILQGMQKISEIIKSGLYASITSTFLLITLYYFFGLKAIVPGILIMTIVNLFFSWYFTKNIKMHDISLSFNETFREGFKIIKLGFFITLSGLTSNLTLYIVRIVLLEKSNLIILGAFQSSWTISTLFLSVFLTPLLLEFYPRLTKEAHDKNNINNLINEQLEITTLLAAPVIITIMVLSEPILHILYSRDFVIATPLLQWQMAGTFFIIISWPLGVLFLVKDKGLYSFLTDIFRLFLFVLFILIGFDSIGFAVLGIAYLVSNILTSLFIYLLTAKMVSFKYYSNNLKHILFFSSLLVIGLFNIFSVTNDQFQIITSTALVFFSIIYSVKNLNNILNIRNIISNRLIKRIK
jgi:O-antigen/teichoic acid export membrane protein